MKQILEKLLAILARAIIRKYKPKVIGITGSMGKTSAKEAVFSVLESKFNVRKNIKNYNNEIGVPLTIIGLESGGKSPIKWGIVFASALKQILIKNKKYPEMLVLEMGADKPGDIEYLVKISPCDIGVVTSIGPAHLEEFKTIENIAKEKQKIVTHLNKNNTAILNRDDELVKKMHQRVKANIIYFGYDEAANIRAIDMHHHGEGLDLSGIKFKIAFGGSTVPVMVPGVVGAHQINSALIGAAVGVAVGMNLIEVSEGLKNYKSPNGRMSLVPGANNTLIIDDTYNSSPRAAHAALDTLDKLNIEQVERKVAILGDMLELGDYSDEAHIELGKKAVESGVDLLISVGKFRDLVLQGAKAAGLSEQNMCSFEDSIKATEQINELIKANDLILVKGSRGSRMERVVKKLMKEPEKAEQLLVRQDDSWK